MSAAPILTEMDAFALSCAGFEFEHVPESWEDIGGPESGPRLSGSPAADFWTHWGRRFQVVVDPATQAVLVAEHDPWIGYDPEQ